MHILRKVSWEASSDVEAFKGALNILNVSVTRALLRSKECLLYARSRSDNQHSVKVQVPCSCGGSERKSWKVITCQASSIDSNRRSLMYLGSSHIRTVG
jgi:hypothetical protein